jgi:hypothetical protein
LEHLHAAIRFGILDKAGPKRTTLLANIYKDPRVANLDIAPLLKKMLVIIDAM